VELRSTIIAALAIPVSIIASFRRDFGARLFAQSDDDARAHTDGRHRHRRRNRRLENIYRFVEEKGMTPFQAAIEGTREIGLAVLATTLRFSPSLFRSVYDRHRRPFMSSFGLTSAAAIAVSLIVSFTLTPMLAARWIKPKKVSLTDENEANVEPSGAAKRRNSAATGCSSRTTKSRPPIEPRAQPRSRTVKTAGFTVKSTGLTPGF
jgi:HAE1 family hydrophobic/amphiphilic exporter-1